MINNITILLTTCNRYETTLPMCLMSIFNQSYKPNKIVLVDDSKIKKFYNYPSLINILSLFKENKIEFEYFYGESKGAVPALQIGLNNIENGWVLKIDDDNVLSYNTLEIFVNNIKDNIGAMGSIIIDKQLNNFYLNNKDKSPTEVDGVYNKIENIYSELNIQMLHNQSKEIKKVEHLYSNYFFNREIVNDYPLELSPSSVREETIFTYEIFNKGYDLIVIPDIKIYHICYDNKSGNRQYSNEDVKKNEKFFIEKLKQWKIVPNKLEILEDNIKFYIKKNSIDYLVYYK